MTSISKNVYTDKLDDIVNEYNNKCHRTTKMKPIDVKSSNHVEYNVNSNDKDPKFQVGDHVRISKYKNIFARGYTSNWSENLFEIKKVKNTLPWTYVTNDLNSETISKDNDIEMHSVHNEGKSVVADRFIRTLKNKIL